jgi:hypothetical protein
VYVKDDERHDHFLWVDLIDGTPTPCEVRRRIDVRAPLTDVTKLLREET